MFRDFPGFSFKLTDCKYPLHVPRITTREYKSNLWSATARQFRNQPGKRNLIGRGALKIADDTDIIFLFIYNTVAVVDTRDNNN